MYWIIFNLKAPRLVERKGALGQRISRSARQRRIRGISLKNAWGLMQESNVVTLPCVAGGGRSLEGRYHYRRYHQVLHELI